MGVDPAPGVAKKKSLQSSPSFSPPSPQPPYIEPNQTVVAQFVSRGFRVSQVREALILTEGDEALAEEVLKNWKRIPPPSFATTGDGDATEEVVEEVIQDRYEKQRTLSWSESWPSATPRVLFDELRSPVLSAAEAADILDTGAMAEKVSEKAADMRDKATDVAEKAATWIQDAFQTVSRSLTQDVNEGEGRGEGRRKELSHRDSYEEFYGYGYDGAPTPPVRSRRSSSPNYATARLFQTVYLPDQDMSLKDIDIEEAPDDEINLEDDDGTARTWEVLKSMSTLFPSMPSMNSTPVGSTECDLQEKEAKKQRRADSTRQGEISALLANGWMDPDSVRRLKDELKELQAKAAADAKVQPAPLRISTCPPGGYAGVAEPSRANARNFERGPAPALAKQQPPPPPPPLTTTKDSLATVQESSPAAAPAQVAPVKAKPAGKGVSTGSKGKGKGGHAASSQETEPLTPSAPAHLGKGGQNSAAPPAKGAPSAPGKGGGKGPGAKGATGPPKAPQKGGPPPAKGGGKGGPVGKAPGAKAPGAKAGAKAKATVPNGKPIGRRFDWKMLPSDKVEGTVFANLSAKVSVDVACLRALFEKPKEVEEKTTTRKSMPGMKIGETEVEVQLLARSRAQNIMIALRKQPVTDAVMDALDKLDFEATALSPEAIEVLIGAVPTPEEAKLLVGHRTGKLREVEIKILPLARLERPAAGQRLRLMLFRKTMGGLSEDVHVGLKTIKDAFDDAQNSPAFRTVLCHTVRLGSVINFGSSKAEADDAAAAEKAAAAVGGFGLDALSRLALFRAPGNSRITLLHVLVAQVSVADPELPKRLTEEMGNVHKAAKRSLSSLADDTAAFIREAEHVSSCAPANGGCNSSDDPVTEKLAKFSDHASREAGSLATELKETREAARATLSFFAIKSTPKDVDTKSLELCSLLSEFLSVFEKTKKEIMKNPALASVCHSGAPKSSKVPGMDSSTKAPMRPMALQESTETSKESPKMSEHVTATEESFKMPEHATDQGVQLVSAA